HSTPGGQSASRSFAWPMLDSAKSAAAPSPAAPTPTETKPIVRLVLLGRGDAGSGAGASVATGASVVTGARVVDAGVSVGLPGGRSGATIAPSSSSSGGTSRRSSPELGPRLILRDHVFFP